MFFSLLYPFNFAVGAAWNAAAICKKVRVCTEKVRIVW